VSNKLERLVAQTYGFTPDDFGPGGVLGKFSQEMDFIPDQGKFVVVDDADRTKIVKTLSYADGLAAGFPEVTGSVGPSYMDRGEWKYTRFEGNPVFYAPKPSSFSGLGHVADPADKTAVVLKMAAAKNKSDFYDGMDGGGVAPDSMSDSGRRSADMSIWAADTTANPDLLTADVSKFHKEEDDGKAPDDFFACQFSMADFSSVTNGQPSVIQKRAFRIKDDKGNLDRKRLIAAYQALMGVRGAIHKADEIPARVRKHGLSVVRQGLKATLPNFIKEKSSLTMPDLPTVEELNEQIKQLKEVKAVSKADHDAVIAERDAKAAEVANLTASLEAANAQVESIKTALATAEADVAEFKNKALSAQRYAELEAVLPFGDTEKADADAHEAFKKSLASLTPEQFDIQVLSRKNTKLVAALEAAQANSGTQLRLVAAQMPQTNPVPEPSGASAPERLSVANLY
jgi:hypothetical protein